MKPEKSVQKNNEKMQRDLIGVLHDVVAALWVTDNAIKLQSEGKKVENMEDILKMNQKIFDFMEVEIKYAEEADKTA